MGYEKIALRNEVARCLLCNDAPCDKVCPASIEPASIIRSLYFKIWLVQVRSMLGIVMVAVRPALRLVLGGRLTGALIFPRYFRI